MIPLRRRPFLYTALLAIALTLPACATSPSSSQPETSMTRQLELRQLPSDGPIEVERRFEVFADNTLQGTIILSGPGTYGVKPRVKILDPHDHPLFDGLWEQPFDYDELPATLAHHFF